MSMGQSLQGMLVWPARSYERRGASRMFSRALVLFAVAIIAASDDDGCVDLSDDCYDYEINPSICHSSIDDDGTENCCICGGGDTSAAASCTSAGDCASGLCDVSAADCSACGSLDETNSTLGGGETGCHQPTSRPCSRSSRTAAFTA